MRTFRLIFLLVALFLVTLQASAQNRCLTPDEATKLVASVNMPVQPPPNLNSFRREVANLAKEQARLSAEILADFAKGQTRVAELHRMGETNLVRVCELLKQNGWPDSEALKDEGTAALRYLILNNKATNMQRELLPVLVAASKKGDISRPVLADLVDTIRVGSGVPQIFGTQGTRRGDVIYILPLLNDAKVDDWRREYELPPLADEIRDLETRFVLPVLKSQRLSSQMVAARQGTSDVAALGITDANGDIKIETKIVNLNVRVFTQDLKTPYGITLERSDFSIVEDGVEQDTEFFSTEAAPFDLVLLLDFSGSTADKRSLIKKAAKRFVEVARPDDRVSVIAFADEIKLISDFTSDKSALYAAIDKIKTEGGSPVWDSLKFAFEKIAGSKRPGRRSALVFMTDGEDNASKTTYADVMETVRHGDTTVFSVYVNSFDAAPSQKNYVGRLVSKLQSSLQMIADETGGQFYKANGFKDLNGIYEQVVSDIGRTYSLGYESKNEDRDGGWRPIVVQLKKHPELTAKTRRGYYAN